MAIQPLGLTLDHRRQTAHPAPIRHGFTACSRLHSPYRFSAVQVTTTPLASLFCLAEVLSAPTSTPRRYPFLHSSNTPCLCSGFAHPGDCFRRELIGSRIQGPITALRLEFHFRDPASKTPRCSNYNRDVPLHL